MERWHQWMYRYILPFSFLIYQTWHSSLHYRTINKKILEIQKTCLSVFSKYVDNCLLNFSIDADCFFSVVP
jgi:hypothetical protein